MQTTSNYQGKGKPNSPSGSSAALGLTVVGITTQGHFFREQVPYSQEIDGFHFLSKHSIAEQTPLLLEIENPDRNSLPAKVRAKVISCQPSATSPGMFELIAQREGANPIVGTAPKGKTLVSPAPAAPAKPAVLEPELKVAPMQAAKEPPVVPPLVVTPPALPAVTPSTTISQPVALTADSESAEKDLQSNMDDVARAVGFEVQEVPSTPEPERSSATQESLHATVSDSAEEFLREQFSSRLQTQTDESVRQSLEQMTRSLGDLSSQLRKRADEESEQLLGGYREKFKQALEMDLQASQAQAASMATRAEELFARVASELEARKSELQDWAVSIQASNVQSAAAAVEEALVGIRAQMDAEFQTKLAAAQGVLDVQFDHSKRRVAELLNEIEQRREEGIFSLTAQTQGAAKVAEETFSGIRAQWDTELHAKVAAAQRTLEVQLDQSKKHVTELLGQMETCRQVGISSAAEVNNAQAQINLLRQNLKTESGAAESRLAKAIQEAMTRLNAEADLRTSDGLHQIDSDLQIKQAAFQKFVSRQLDAARGQAAGLLDSLEDCRNNAVKSLQTVDTARQSLEQLRETCQSEMQAGEAKFHDMSRRVLLLASAETTRLLNRSMGSLEEKLRERIAEMESSCNGVAANAAQQVETSAAKLKKTETAAGALLADVDASLNRSTQTLEAMNQLQASLTSNFRQALAAELENLSSQSRKHLEEQCKRLVTLHASTLEKQAALHEHAAEQALQRVSEEQRGVAAASQLHRELLEEESKKLTEEFRSSVAQYSDQLKSEVEHATRLAQEALEQEFSSKIKYLVDNTSDIVRRLFNRSSGQ